ncbi:hypothetical protein CFC21_097474 [Triticum aestivum]|uniref:Uncharacterized protein n=3 Tax=Triticum TaxID=4564 RepID=A0A9R0Z9M5_TRITD|nr:uncharacterized protein LOC123151066 [Triticum aestivum]KAF7095267.1 hypothetical protein CFC21_097474 [Triticum aestivum]VAI73866.1 unnamed protein product [Triticum turgidum subsp. durum]
MASTLSCFLPPPPAASPTRLRRSGASAGRPGRQCRAWSNAAGTRMRRGGGRLRVEALFGDGGGEGEDAFRAVMRIVRLNSAIQNRSVRELLELVADECRYFCRNIPAVSVSEMSKSVFLFLHEMMLRHQVSFVLKPAENGAFDLGVKWSLEWKGQKLPWDVDCTVSTTHVYTGLLLISQVNKACGPLLQRILQMIYQNLDAVVLIVANKFLPDGTLDEKERSNIIVCAIIGLVVMVLFYAMFNNL